MAIDSAEKRKSISGIGGPPLIPGVTPNIGQDQEWRQESGWSYSGILAGGAPLPAAAVLTTMYDWRAWRGARAILAFLGV